jgi:hypothetical protein
MHNLVTIIQVSTFPLEFYNAQPGYYYSGSICSAPPVLYFIGFRLPLEVPVLHPLLSVLQGPLFPSPGSICSAPPFICIMGFCLPLGVSVVHHLLSVLWGSAFPWEYL